MPKRELPPEVAKRISQVVADFTEKLTACLEESFRFYGMETLDAVLELLEESGKPIPRGELELTLKRGGLGMKASASFGGPEGDLARSISFYTSRKKKIQEINGMVGRAEWPSKMFKRAK